MGCMLLCICSIVTMFIIALTTALHLLYCYCIAAYFTADYTVDYTCCIINCILYCSV
jgi:hypothetical protein